MNMKRRAVGVTPMPLFAKARKFSPVAAIMVPTRHLFAASARLWAPLARMAAPDHCDEDCSGAAPGVHVRAGINREPG